MLPSDSGLTQGSFLLHCPGPGSVQRLQKDQRSWGRSQSGVCGRAAGNRERCLPQWAVAAACLDHRLLCLPVAGVLGGGSRVGAESYLPLPPLIW